MSVSSDPQLGRRQAAHHARVWSFGAALLAVAYVVLYVVLATRHGSGIVNYYLAVLLLAIALIVASMLVPARRVLLIVAAILLGAASLLGVQSIGIMLLPAIVVTAYAAYRAG